MERGRAGPPARRPHSPRDGGFAGCAQAALLRGDGRSLVFDVVACGRELPPSGAGSAPPRRAGCEPEGALEAEASAAAVSFRASEIAAAGPARLLAPAAGSKGCIDAFLSAAYSERIVDPDSQLPAAMVSALRAAGSHGLSEDDVVGHLEEAARRCGPGAEPAGLRGIARRLLDAAVRHGAACALPGWADIRFVGGAAAQRLLRPEGGGGDPPRPAGCAVSRRWLGMCNDFDGPCNSVLGEALEKALVLAVMRRPGITEGELIGSQAIASPMAARLALASLVRQRLMVPQQAPRPKALPPALLRPRRAADPEDAHQLKGHLRSYFLNLASWTSGMQMRSQTPQTGIE